jgi:calcineurin-like phosphoesterase family protein
MTRNIFVVSDTHFGHENILKFLNEDNSHVRSFADVDQMNEQLVDNWNKTVRDEDIVYHLGDVYFGQGHRVLPRLRGRKRLILGNHDNGKSEHLQKHFQKILLWRMFPEFNCLLTHVPVHKSALYKVHYNLHGHVHRSSLNEEQYVNCCVEVNDYKPRALEELVPA